MDRAIERTVSGMSTTMPLLRPSRRGNADAEHIDFRPAPHLAHYGADLGGADVDANDDPFLILRHYYCAPLCDGVGAPDAGPHFPGSPLRARRFQPE